jgi:hypothetical protein
MRGRAAQLGGVDGGAAIAMALPQRGQTICPGSIDEAQLGQYMREMVSVRQHL